MVDHISIHFLSNAMNANLARGYLSNCTQLLKPRGSKKRSCARKVVLTDLQTGPDYGACR